MKGIILAGGKATRLYPITKAVCKQLLPVYNKPMIYYPLSVLMLSAIKEILIISTSQELPRFKDLLGSGEDLGINIDYKEQKEPCGIAQAFIIGEEFIDNDRVCLILGDNLFFGEGLFDVLKRAREEEKGATIFGYYVSNPQRYGVIEFDKKRNVISLTEKPKIPKSNWAVTGLYYYDNQVVNIAKDLKPSGRGELEITDINKAYLEKKMLEVTLLGRGYAWLDTGTYDSLIDASNFVKTLEDRQVLMVGCIEEIAYRMGYISKEQLVILADKTNTNYGKYLLRISQEG